MPGWDALGICNFLRPSAVREVADQAGGREGVNRAVVGAGVVIVVLVLLAVASVFLTNELFKVTAPEHPTVTFSAGSPRPSPSPSHP